MAGEARLRLKSCCLLGRGASGSTMSVTATARLASSIDERSVSDDGDVREGLAKVVAAAAAAAAFALAFEVAVVVEVGAARESREADSGRGLGKYDDGCVVVALLTEVVVFAPVVGHL